MAQQKHPAIITRAHLGYHDRAESISTDVKGNVFVSMYQIGVLHLRPGSAPAWVDVGEEVATRMSSAAVSPDGKQLYVATWDGDMWEHSMGGGPESSQLVDDCSREIGHAEDKKWVPLTMLCTDCFVYYWRMADCDMHLLRLQRASWKVQLLYVHRGRSGDSENYPSWALDEPAGLLYIKPKHHKNQVVRVELREGQAADQLSTSTLQLPREVQGEAHLSNCALGDGRLVVCGDAERQMYLYRPPGLPSGQASSSTSSSTGELQLLADGTGLEMEDGMPFDNTEGSPCRLFGPQAASAVDAEGRLWFLDLLEESTYLRCLFAPLLPPAHLSAALASSSPSAAAPPAAAVNSPSTSLAERWAVGGKASIHNTVTEDLGQLLASGEGADVVLLAADGLCLCAHSLVLRARCEWFRWRAASGMQEAAGGQQQQQGMDEVHVEEHPVAVVRALLSFLYTGSAQLAKAGKGEGAEGAGVDATEESSEPPYLLLAQLLHAASVFQVPQLHAACLEVASAQLDVHCALPWLVYGHEHGEVELKQLALGYAAAHYAEIKAAQPEAVEGLAQVEGRLLLELLDARDAVK